jgi:pimeloyl-ACP methyl ester carboxylesterase
MQVLLKNILINYEQFGDGKDNLLILHGWGQSSAPWRNTALYCSKKYKVTVVDFPGFGSSEEPSHIWDTYDYAEFVKDFLTKIGISNTIIMGHSFGGRIGTILASQSPSLVSRLILVDSGGIEIKTFAIKIRILIYKMFIKPIRKLFSERMKKVFGSSDYRTLSGTMRQIFVKVVNQDLRYLFTTIKQPVTVIWGSNDQVLPVKYVKIYKKSIPQAEIKIIWGADHSPNISKTNDFLDVLGDILNI